MLDKILTQLDLALKNITSKPISIRQHPDALITETNLSEEEKNFIIKLMRVNHCGEVCAQALYQGQAITSKNIEIKEKFLKAAIEEIEHLAWTNQRIVELEGKTSILNPMFYILSLIIGIGVGLFGDKWNLGFLSETEKQVEKHLEKHIKLLPSHDKKSLAILQQMQLDEIKHSKMAEESGAHELPILIKNFMQLSSKIMTSLTYRI